LDWSIFTDSFTPGEEAFMKGAVLYGTTLGGFIGAGTGGTGGFILGGVGGAGIGAAPGTVAGAIAGGAAGAFEGGVFGGAIGIVGVFGVRSINALAGSLATFSTKRSGGSSCPSNRTGPSKANPIEGKPRGGSGLKVDQIKPLRNSQGKIIKEFPGGAQAHGFNDIIDNYAGSSKSFTLRKDVELYQLKGSLNGVPGRFEWIVDKGRVTHRMFVPGGRIHGYSIVP
jgi:hypothetical protein